MQGVEYLFNLDENTHFLCPLTNVNYWEKQRNWLYSSSRRRYNGETVTRMFGALEVLSEQSGKPCVPITGRRDDI